MTSKQSPTPSPISGAWLFSIYGSLGLVGAAGVLLGVLNDHSGWLTLGGIAVAAALAGGPIALQLHALLSGRSGGSSGAGEGGDELAGAIREMGELAGLSDDARRVINRRRERELLCRAIEEDIDTGDWDAALVLVTELAERFGYRADAETFRGRIEQARFESMDRGVADGIARIDQQIIERKWASASEEAARVTRLYPDSPRTDGLRHRVEHARSRYKGDLERRFLDAAQGDDVELALRLVRELDEYLTESEAESYMEVARGVIGKAKENLGAEFRRSVHDRDWSRAVRTGERVIEEFPNSRMASEIRGMLDDIRAKAAGLPAVHSEGGSL